MDDLAEFDLPPPSHARGVSLRQAIRMACGSIHAIHDDDAECWPEYDIDDRLYRSAVLLLFGTIVGDVSGRLLRATRSESVWSGLWMEVELALESNLRKPRSHLIRRIQHQVTPHVLVQLVMAVEQYVHRGQPSWEEVESLFEEPLLTDELLSFLEEQNMTETSRLHDQAPTPTLPNRQVMPPVPWTGAEPPFELSHGGGFFGMDRLHPNELVHLASIGGTGVGKTISTVVPLMRAMLRYELPVDGGTLYPAMLVVDPKCELLPIVAKEMAALGRAGDLVVLGEAGASRPVSFFNSTDPMSVADKIDRIDAVLATKKLDTGDHAYWHTAALNLLSQLLNLEEAYRARKRSSLINRVGHLVEIPCTGNFWSDLFALLQKSRMGLQTLNKIQEHFNRTLNSAGLGSHADASVLTAFTCDGDQYNQWHYRVQSLHPITLLLGDPKIAGIVDFDPFPVSGQDSLDVRQAIDAGKVLVFQPENTPSSELAARAIKVKVYEAVKNRTCMQRPVGIVLDEFQKFITCDDVTGDANFLDTARAYRANCVLATQSINALMLALGNDNKAKAAVEAIMANTPSKWFFASKDPATREIVRSLIPTQQGRLHITDVRTLAQRKRGEAYWSLADGRWGLNRALTERFV